MLNSRIIVPRQWPVGGGDILYDSNELYLPRQSLPHWPEFCSMIIGIVHRSGRFIAAERTKRTCS